jgi:cell division septum initiation protein DivIVA
MREGKKMNIKQYKESDRNVFYKLSTGEVKNLLDEAIERIDELEQEIEELLDKVKAGEK